MTTKIVGHTPGPWTVQPSEDQYGYYILLEAAAEQERIWYDDSDAIAKISESHDEANARLIAAAPALLEALENIVSFGKASEWDKAITGCQILLADAQAAIRKARNE